MKNKYKILILFVVVLIISSIILGYFIITNKKNQKKLEEQEKIKIEIKNTYNKFVVTNKITNIYDSNNKKIGYIKKNIVIHLDDFEKTKGGFYKLYDEDYYISYTNVNKSDEKKYTEEYKTYRNYIPFNENIITKDSYKIYFDEKNYIKINESNNFQVIVKDENRYGVVFNDQLVYIQSTDINNIIENNNSDEEELNSIAVLNYHFTIDETSPERQECVQDICISETQVEEEIKYLKDNNFYATTMRDLELFMKGKIRLPKKSVTITIDDGWYVPRMINILNKYELNGTLFLIGSLASPDAYISDYLEIHSHTWDMHKPGVCRGEHGGGILCLDDNTILEDLNKSKESLNNTKYFCFPFYEYNDNAINLLKQAGFEMSFIGGNKKATRNDNIYKIPRYVMYDGLTISTFASYVN